MGVVNTNTIHRNMSVQEDASASYMTVRHTAEADIYSNRYLLKLLKDTNVMINGNNGALRYMQIRISIRMIRLSTQTCRTTTAPIRKNY